LSIFSSKKRSFGAGSEEVDKLWAHFPQNMKSGGLKKLHFGQISSILDAHFPQNCIPSGFSNWQDGHFIFSLSRPGQIVEEYHLTKNFIDASSGRINSFIEGTNEKEG
jgi:hypothetical protein